MRWFAVLLLVLARPALAQAPDSSGVLICFGGEDTPELIGGIEALHRSIIYNGFMTRSHLVGRVIVRMVVDATGVPTQIEVIRSLQPAFDAAAVDAVRRARFRPGTQRGVPIPIRFTLPVTFR